VTHTNLCPLVWICCHLNEVEQESNNQCGFVHIEPAAYVISSSSSVFTHHMGPLYFPWSINDGTNTALCGAFKYSGFTERSLNARPEIRQQTSRCLLPKTQKSTRTAQASPLISLRRPGITPRLLVIPQIPDNQTTQSF
jgi:hypothetical protein